MYRTGTDGTYTLLFYLWVRMELFAVVHGLGGLIDAMRALLSLKQDSSFSNVKVRMLDTV